MFPQWCNILYSCNLTMYDCDIDWYMIIWWNQLLVSSYYNSFCGFSSAENWGCFTDHSQFWGWSLLPIDLIFVGSTKYPMSRPGRFPSLIYGSGRRFVRTWWISHELAIQLPHDGSRSTQTCFSILLVIQLTSSTKSHLFTGVPCPSQNPIQGSSNSAPTEMTCSKICHKLDC